MRAKTFYFKSIIFVFIIFVACIGIAMETIGFHSFGDTIVLASPDEIDNLVPNLPLTMSVEDQGNGNKQLNYKLCNCVTLKKVNLIDGVGKQVILGGKPLGISMSVGGLIVSQKLDVMTTEGLVRPADGVNIECGDIVTHFNGKPVVTVLELANELNSSKGGVTLSLVRGDERLHVNITPANDLNTKARRLGLWLREDIEGVGTLTYIDPENGRYGALGHVIKDFESGMVYIKPQGEIYNANIFGVVKGQRGKAGELSGNFNKTSEKLADLDANCDFGVFGDWQTEVKDGELISLGSKYSVHPGKAYIYTTVDGMQPKRYEIEIIKNSMQSSAKTRGLLIRVTDKELLAKTGGIVQGMSGSPIVQDGKLVGAVTHVFVSDPTKGYGTYIDWMLPN